MLTLRSLTNADYTKMQYYQELPIIGFLNILALEKSVQEEQERQQRLAEMRMKR